MKRPTYAALEADNKAFRESIVRLQTLDRQHQINEESLKAKVKELQDEIRWHKQMNQSLVGIAERRSRVI